MDFREILGVSNRRRLELLESLYYHQKGWSVDQLLINLNCSLPILMNDIKLINSSDPYFKIVKKKGLYYVVPAQSANLSHLYSGILNFIPEYQILEELLYEKCNNITELAEKLQLSPTNARRYIKKIEGVLQRTKMKLCFRPLRIEGNESEVRNFYYRFYKERQNTFKNDLPHLKLDQYLAIEKYVKEFIVENDIWSNYVLRKRLIYNFYISLWRIKNDHYYDKQELRKLGLKVPQKETYALLKRMIKKSSGLDLTPDFMRDCLWLSFSDSIVFSNTHREYALIDNPRYQRLFMQHYELINKYDEMLGYRLTENEKNDYTTLLCNTVYLYDPDSAAINLLWDNRLFFLREAMKLYGTGIKKIRMMVETFTKEHNMYQEEGFIRNYTYLLITVKEKSLKWLVEQDHPVKALLLSDLTMTEENFLAYQIRESIYGNINIDHYEKLSGVATQIYDELERYDCLITTRAIEGLPKGFPVVVIDHFLTPENVKKIQDLILYLDEKRNKALIS